MNKNGDTKPMKITVLFDPANQGVSLDFDESELRNWPYVEALLRIAADLAHTNGQLSMAQAMRQRAVEAQQGQALASQLKLGRM